MGAMCEWAPTWPTKETDGPMDEQTDVATMLGLLRTGVSARGDDATALRACGEVAARGKGVERRRLAEGEDGLGGMP